MPIIQHLAGEDKAEDLKFEANLGYIASSKASLGCTVRSYLKNFFLISKELIFFLYWA
jgi:hypothetical protein